MKPANVFVVRRRDERGTESDFVKLLDFGISKMHGDAATSGLTMTGVAMGTPSYMAPEQFFDARSVDARADLYSVGAMLYELLSGRLPFDAESYAHLIVKVRTEQAPPLNQIAPQVPLALAQVVMVGLAKEPLQRWQTAREFSRRAALCVGPAAAREHAGLPPVAERLAPALAPQRGWRRPTPPSREWCRRRCPSRLPRRPTRAGWCPRAVRRTPGCRSRPRTAARCRCRRLRCRRLPRRQAGWHPRWARRPRRRRARRSSG